MQEQQSGVPVAVAQARWKQIHDNVHNLASTPLAEVQQKALLTHEIDDFMAIYNEAEKIAADGNLYWIDFFTHLMHAKAVAIHSSFSPHPSTDDITKILTETIQAFHAIASQLLEMNQLTHQLDEKLNELEQRAKALDKEKADGGVKVNKLQQKALQLRNHCSEFRENFKDPTKYKADCLNDTLRKVREKALLAELDQFAKELNLASVEMHLNGVNEEALEDLCKKLSAFLNDERIPKSQTFCLIADMLKAQQQSYAECVDAIIEYFKAQAARYRHMFTVKLNSESSLELVRLLMELNPSNVDSISQQIERMQLNWLKKLKT